MNGKIKTKEGKVNWYVFVT